MQKLPTLYEFSIVHWWAAVMHKKDEKKKKKNYLRSTLYQETLNCLPIRSTERDLTKSQDYDNVVYLLAEQKSRLKTL